MKLESVVIDDDLAAAVGRLWPDARWCEVIEHGIALAIDCATTADRDAVSPDHAVDDSDDLEAGGDAAA